MGRVCARILSWLQSDFEFPSFRILNYTKYFSLTLLFALLSTDLAANPVIVLRRPPHRPSIADLPVGWVPWIIAFALIVEFLLLYIWITNREPGRAWRVALAILLMHLVTYPITFYFGNMIGLKAELFPLAFEVWLFPQMAGLSVRRTIVPVTVANLTSFTLGLVLPTVCVALFLPRVIF